MDCPRDRERLSEDFFHNVLDFFDGIFYHFGISFTLAFFEFFIRVLLLGIRLFRKEYILVPERMLFHITGPLN